MGHGRTYYALATPFIIALKARALLRFALPLLRHTHARGATNNPVYAYLHGPPDVWRASSWEEGAVANRPVG